MRSPATSIDPVSDRFSKITEMILAQVKGMTRFIHDQFSKDYLEELLKPFGTVQAPSRVAAEVNRRQKAGGRRQKEEKATHKGLGLEPSPKNC